jgi:DNA polymerase V
MVGQGYDGGRTTGSVSPASDSLEGPIDLSEILDLTRPHRYPVRVVGQAPSRARYLSRRCAGVDASAGPAAGKVCVAFLHGDVILAILARRGSIWLEPSGPLTEPMPVQGDAAEIWAIVSGLVRTDV